MITRDNAVRKETMADFHTIVAQAADCIAQALSSMEQPPPLQLTRDEYEKGEWPIPAPYRKLIDQVRREFQNERLYEISNAQLRLAILQGTERVSLLYVGGMLVVTPKPDRCSTHWSHRGNSRRRTSLRNQA